MKQFLLTLAIGLSLHTAMAQDSTKLRSQNQRDHGRHQHHSALRSLNLSEDQKDQLAALQKEHKAKMMAILTPAQREQLRKQKAENKARLAEKSAARMEKMKTKLNLTPDQFEKITRLNQDFREKADLIKANQALAAAEQRKQLKALVEAHQTDLKAMLDPGQQSILEAIKTRHHRPATR
jgi:hypothetical protein